MSCRQATTHTDHHQPSDDMEPSSHGPIGSNPERGRAPRRRERPTQPLLQLEAAVPNGAVGPWSASVVLAGYGEDLDGLERSIYAALGQTLGGVQVVIVGDSAMVVPADRLRSGGQLLVVAADEGGDRSLDRECGLLAASGELVAFLEPGDLWFEDHLERAAAGFEGGGGVGLVLAPVAYPGSDDTTFVREPDFEALRAAGAQVPTGRVLGDLLPIWTVSAFVARRAALVDQALCGSMLVNRAGGALVDAQKWSNFTACWGLRGVSAPPAPGAYEEALARCVWVMLGDQAGQLEGESLGVDGPTVGPSPRQDLDGFVIQVDHDAYASGRVSSSLLTQAARLVRQLWLEVGPASSAGSQRASLVLALQRKAPELMPLLDLTFFAHLELQAVARLLGMPLAKVQREHRRAEALLRHLG